MVMKIFEFVPFQTETSKNPPINFCRGCPFGDIYYFFGATKWWSQKNFQPLICVLVYMIIKIQKLIYIYIYKYVGEYRNFIILNMSNIPG